MENIAPIIIASILVLIYRYCLSWYAQKTRTSKYQLQNTKDKEERNQIEQLCDEKLQRLYNIIKPVWYDHHTKSITHQNLYYKYLYITCGQVFLSFFLLVLSSVLFYKNLQFKHFATWYEFFALIDVVTCFLLSKKHLKPWITNRVKAELGRMRSICYITLEDIDDNLKSHKYFKNKVSFELNNIPCDGIHNVEDLFSFIDHYWSNFCENSFKNYSVLPKNKLNYYFVNRVSRQLIWFRSSKSRLHRSSVQRQWRLSLLFFTVFSLVFLKLLLFTYSSNITFLSNLATFIIIISTAIAGSYTAFYLNSNMRSIEHRYNTQIRELNAISDAISGKSNSQSNQNLITSEFIMQFEKEMISELKDWIHLTWSDHIELAP